MSEEKVPSQVGDEVGGTHDRFVQLVSGLTPLDAQILLGRLQAEGIDAHLLGVEVVQNNQYWRNAFGGVRVMVRAWQEVAAAQVIASVNSGDYSSDDPEDIHPSSPATYRAKRWFGWTVVIILTVVFGGIALGAIWSPSYDYFPYSMTPEPLSHVVGKWVLSATVFLPTAFWLFFVEVSLKRKKR